MQRCLCFSLRTGGLIFGILEIIVAILGALFWSTFVFAILPILGDVITELQNSNSTDISIFNSTISENNTSLEDAEQERILFEIVGDGLKQFEEISLLFTPVILACCFLSLIFGSTLIHGIRKKSTCLLVTWMVYQAIIIVLDISFDIFIYCSIGISTRHFLLLFMSFVVTPLINLLAFKVVYDLRKQMLQNSGKSMHF